MIGPKADPDALSRMRKFLVSRGLPSVFGLNIGNPNRLSVFPPPHTQPVPVHAATARFVIERLPAEFLPEKIGVRRIGEAINQMPAVVME